MSNNRTVNDLTVKDLNIEATDSSFLGFDNDALSSALAGKTVISNTTNSDIVLNFRKSPAGSPLPYMGEVAGKIVYFDSKGVSRDGTIKCSLASSTVGNTNIEGDSQTRTDDDAEFVMNSLNYKEQVAVRCLAAIIKQEPNPLGYDDAKIKLMVSTAFRFAVEFQNRAILFRKEEDDGETPPAVGVDVDADTLTTNTDKILYNINENLKSGIVVKGEAQTLGGTVTPLKIKVTELPEIKFDEALDVNVESMPAE